MIPPAVRSHAHTNILIAEYSVELYVVDNFMVAYRIADLEFTSFPLIQL